MTYFQITTDVAGQIDVYPRRVKIVTSQDSTTVTSTGWLNYASKTQGFKIYPTDIFDVIYSYNPLSGSGTYGEYLCTISSGNITLYPNLSIGNVTLPVVSGNLSSFDGTTGLVKDSGVSSVNPIFAGNVQAGLSGTAGVLKSFPATASKGSLVLAAVENTGNTVTTISNAAMGQAAVVSIPDPGASTANFLLDKGTNTMAAGSRIVLAKSTGTEASNAVTVSAQAGVITTSSLTTAGAASYAITWTNTFISTSSAILLTIMGGTNTVKNITLQATAGNGSSTLTIYNNTAATSLDGTIIIGFLVV